MTAARVSLRGLKGRSPALWDEIRDAFITGRTRTTMATAQQFNIPYKTIADRATRERWVEARTAAQLGRLRGAIAELFNVHPGVIAELIQLRATTAKAFIEKGSKFIEGYKIKKFGEALDLVHEGDSVGSGLMKLLRDEGDAPPIDEMPEMATLPAGSSDEGVEETVKKLTVRELTLSVATRRKR